MYDVIVLGGGPAGCAAGVYAARKKLKTLLITETFGGQSIVSDNIENWIGEIKLTGYELAQKLEAHIRAQEEVEIKTPEIVIKVERTDNGFRVLTKGGGTYEGLALIVAIGGRHRRLMIPGEEKFMGKGVVYCATCDAPFYKNKTVAVVGAGNSGLEAVVDLLPYANKIYLLNRRSEPKGDPATLDEIKKQVDLGKIEILNDTVLVEILGEETLNGIVVKNTRNSQTREIAVDGVFVEVGTVPNSDVVRGLVDLNEKGEIVTNPKTGAASCPGIFAAGDVSDTLYKQSNIAAGDAVKAALSAYQYILQLKKN